MVASMPGMVTVGSAPRAAADRDAASRLLGVDGLRVIEVQDRPGAGVSVLVETDADSAQVCPGCRTRATQPHGWVLTQPRDLRRGADVIALVWRKQRWKCTNRGCRRATFTESVPAVGPRKRLTGRLREHAAHLVGQVGATVSAAAAECGLSWPTAHAAFTAHADQLLAAAMTPVRVLGIDETRRGRPRFRRDPDTGEYQLLADRWHTGFVDIEGGQGLLGQVEGRTADDTSYWLAQAGPAWRQGVEVVVIDMCTIYASAVRRMLPHAELAVDAFHVVQLATKMVGDVRRRVVRAKYGRRGRTGDIEYGIKNLLLRNLEHLRPDQYDKIERALADDPHGRQIKAAWIAKEKLRDVIRCRPSFTGHAATASTVRDKLGSFFSWCADHDDIPEIVTLAKTIDRWRDSLIAAVLLNVSNAKSEGLNRVLKLEARKAYGFRNPTNQRRRLRYATTNRPIRRTTRSRKRRARPAATPPPRPG